MIGARVIAERKQPMPITQKSLVAIAAPGSRRRRPSA